jgi:hypothetical protein
MVNDKQVLVRINPNAINLGAQLLKMQSKRAVFFDSVTIHRTERYSHRDGHHRVIRESMAALQDRESPTINKP